MQSHRTSGISHLSRSEKMPPRQPVWLREAVISGVELHKGPARRLCPAESLWKSPLELKIAKRQSRPVAPHQAPAYFTVLKARK